MKFLYQYRTPDNKQHRAVIRAASKDAVYALLKAQGIKPGRVEEAPGFFNKLFGKGKRWLAIGVLALIALVAIATAHKLHRRMGDALTATVVEERSQLYGDPVVIQECEDAGWTNVFDNAFDCLLAHYAVPGRAVPQMPKVDVADVEKALALVAIRSGELEEAVKMKRMVNGMKQELREYIADGGTIRGYVKRLSIRQRAESDIFDLAQKKSRRMNGVAELKAINRELRARGLPMLDFGAENGDRP